MLKRLLFWYYLLYAGSLAAVCWIQFGLRQPLLAEVDADTLQVLKTLSYLLSLGLAPFALWLFARMTKKRMAPEAYRRAFLVKTALFAVPVVFDLVLYALLMDLSGILMLAIVLLLWVLAKPTKADPWAGQSDEGEEDPC